MLRKANVGAEFSGEDPRNRGNATEVAARVEVKGAASYFDGLPANEVPNGVTITGMSAEIR